MPRFAANLSMLYPEQPFLARFEAAARDGFSGVECLFPYTHAQAGVRAALAASGLPLVLFNTPPGGWTLDEAEAAWARGDRGTACQPGREAEFRAGLTQALDWAAALGCPRLHCMAGLRPAGVTPEAARATLLANLRWAAPLAARQGVQLLIEPINPRDMPGFAIQRQAEAHALVQAAGAPNLGVQMDLYHCQMAEGDVAARIRQYLPTGRVGHFQVAGVPGRHEPDVGELPADALFDVIDEVAAACGWQGWVGCEYRPARGTQPGGTRAGLGWLHARQARQKEKMGPMGQAHR
ncbi:MAG: TIM barrel protein [Comamonadaceae bacterium]|nr:TIM barrel protein [Comamonadaceae bacterium]